MDKTTLDYLEDARKVLGNVSDYKLAEALEISRSSVCRYMQKDAIMNPEICFKLAVILKVDPAEIVATAEFERAKTDDKREIFRSFLHNIGRAAGWLVAVSAVALISLGHAPDIGDSATKTAAAIAAFYMLFRNSHNGSLCQRSI